jgi:hypothetical protein
VQEESGMQYSESGKVYKAGSTAWMSLVSLLNMKAAHKRDRLDVVGTVFSVAKSMNELDRKGSCWSRCAGGGD